MHLRKAAKLRTVSHGNMFFPQQARHGVYSNTVHLGIFAFQVHQRRRW
jgi:hypothetical protein